MGALMLGLCVLVGWLPASAVSGEARHLSPFGASYAGLIMVALCGWLGLHVRGHGAAKAHVRQPSLPPSSPSSPTMWLPADTYINGHGYAVYARQVAPIVRTFVLEHFDEIDADLRRYHHR